MATVKYHVRVQSQGDRDAYVMRSSNGLPLWTWIQPTPLPLGEAEILRRDASGYANEQGVYLELEEAI